MSTIELKAIKWIQKNILLIGIIIFTIISFCIRWSCINYKSGDYNSFLINWWNGAKQYHGFPSLRIMFGDYNVPYMVLISALSYITDNGLYAIKLLSISFDYVCAIGIGLIIYQLTLDKFKTMLGYVLITFSPTLILNSAFWGQCDSIYVSFLILCVWQLMREHYTCAFILYSIAFSFKLEAVLMLPILIILYFVNKKFSIINFALIPAIFVISTIPAIIAGRTMSNIFWTLQAQTKEYDRLTLNYPNLYAFINGEYKYFRAFGIWLTIGLLGIVLILIMIKNLEINHENFLILSIFTILIGLFFLPSMHERYGLIIDLLSIAFLIIYPRDYYITLGINFVSLIGYIACLWGINDYTWKFTSLVLFSTLIYILRHANTMIKCERSC